MIKSPGLNLYLYAILCLLCLWEGKKYREVLRSNLSLRKSPLRLSQSTPVRRMGEAYLVNI
jgi:hypothetical protein